MESILQFLLIVIGLQCSLISAEASVLEEDPNPFSDKGKNFPCPNEGLIYPCKCYNNNDFFTMDMDCSHVDGEKELERVFKSHIEIPIFRRFTLYDNFHVKTLHSGVFRECTFVDLRIHTGALEKVEVGVLEESAYTLAEIDFHSNRFASVDSFPFSTLQSYSNLSIFDLSYNNIPSWPSMASNSLKKLYLLRNPITYLPADAFQDLPNMEVIDLYDTKLNAIEPGTFSDLTSLRVLKLSTNQLKIIPANAITTGSSQLEDIYLNFNLITEVEPQAFDYVSGTHVHIWNNLLKTLEEEVWRGLLETGGRLEVYGNPLECDCSMAWLIRNPLLLGQVDDDSDHRPTCRSGEYLHDLNPDSFTDCL